MQPENLLIPLHAYPVMNETKFPSRIDFGKCAVGAVVSRKVKMDCKVGVAWSAVGCSPPRAAGEARTALHTVESHRCSSLPFLPSFPLPSMLGAD